MGHVVLYVTDVQKMANFYGDILGFKEVGRMKLGGKDSAIAFSSGRTHHELLLIEIGGKPKSKHSAEPGLYHIGFKIGNSTEELKNLYHELKAKGVSIVGKSDHTVTHSLYILDPDGNELELYADVSDIWKQNPDAVLSPTKSLDLD